MFEIYFSRRFWSGGFVGPVDYIDEETSERGACADNEIDCGRGIYFDAVTGPCGEKYRTYSKNVTSAYTKYFMLEGL